jgi:endonuclease YncB( thermonuclease family)
MVLKNRREYYIIFFLLFLFPIACLSQKYAGTILRVIDGDTFIFQTDEGNLRIRMFGIDAPEKSQEFGLESKAFLEGYLHKTGILEKKSIDKYGRTLGILFVNGVNINLESVKKGYSWHYAYYYKSEEFAQAQNDARVKRLGLWSDNNPVPPWKYRKDHE